MSDLINTAPPPAASPLVSGGDTIYLSYQSGTRLFDDTKWGCHKHSDLVRGGDDDAASDRSVSPVTMPGEVVDGLPDMHEERQRLEQERLAEEQRRRVALTAAEVHAAALAAAKPASERTVRFAPEPQSCASPKPWSDEGGGDDGCVPKTNDKGGCFIASPMEASELALKLAKARAKKLRDELAHAESAVVSAQFRLDIQYAQNARKALGKPLKTRLNKCRRCGLPKAGHVCLKPKLASCPPTSVATSPIEDETTGALVPHASSPSTSVATSLIEDDKTTGAQKRKYNCKLCGVPKKGHKCNKECVPIVPKPVFSSPGIVATPAPQSFLVEEID